MTTAVELPALTGQSALGFLAALGLMRLLDTARIHPMRLSFSRHSAAAVLESPLRSVDEIAGELQQLVARTPEGAVTGLDPRFPLPASRQGGDPMRRPRDAFPDLVAEVRGIDPQAAADWLPCLFTDLAVDGQGRADLTPFCAPSGKQNLRTFFDKPLSAVRADPSLLQEALTNWRRVDSFTGEYLDHQVLNSAADDPAGRAGAERGVPGATWLATMAIPLLRVTGNGERANATLWHQVGRREVMIWPLWEQPLTLPAVRVLIEHPCLKPPGDRVAVSSKQWPALRIFAVYGAERQRIAGRNFAGVLAPCHVEVTPG